MTKLYGGDLLFFNGKQNLKGNTTLKRKSIEAPDRTICQIKHGLANQRLNNRKQQQEHQMKGEMTSNNQTIPIAAHLTAKLYEYDKNITTTKLSHEN